MVDVAETKVDEQDQAEQDVGSKFGRALDIAGIVAGVFLGIIIFDVLSGGRITRLLSRSKPCEGCADKAEAGQEVVSDG